MSVGPRLLDEHLTRVQARVLLDAWNEATRRYWIRRAEAFEAAATERPGDTPGQATEAERDARIRGLVEAAVACRNRALLVDGTAEQHLLETIDSLGKAAA